jgi:hypothetical protein
MMERTLRARSIGATDSIHWLSGASRLRPMLVSPSLRLAHCARGVAQLPPLGALEVMTKKKYPFWFVSSHTFILGAGATRAAFPNGDKYGQPVPLMKDFVKVLALDDFFSRHRIEFADHNIEDIYDQLYASDPSSPVLEELNQIIVNYFSSLRIPDEVTLYDELILSLQKKDAIFSFNWDPLLVQAYSRNLAAKELPDIHFLHGNVAIGICKKDRHVGYLGNKCSLCNSPLTPTKLLYPIKTKSYTSDPFIESEWRALEYYIDNSFILSIFGYSAPKTDVEAIAIMQKAWSKNSLFELNEIDIIDIKPREEVEDNWSGFMYKSHGGIFDDVRDTHSFSYARRSCESWGEAIMQCAPWHENNLPRYTNLLDLQRWVEPLVQEEIDFKENDVLLKDPQGT